MSLSSVPIIYKTDTVSSDQGFIVYMNPNNSLKDRYELIKEDILKLSDLENNWDGYGSLSVYKEVIETAQNLLPFINSDFIDRLSDFYPNNNGTIVLEWVNGKGEKLLLEIGQKNYSYFLKLTECDPKFVDGEDILSDIKKLTADLGKLYRDEVPKYILY
jgi:hypothetical protein